MDLKKYITQAENGRVIQTEFILLDDLDRRILTQAQSLVHHQIFSGFSGATRGTLVLFPEHIPNVSDPLSIYEISGDFPKDWDETDIRVMLHQHGCVSTQLGDIRFERGTYVVAAIGKAKGILETLDRLGEVEVGISKIELSDSKQGKRKEVVVPSMRIDVVGARGFGVSRAYFQSGVEGGKVKLNGQVVKGSAEIRQGDQLSAEGLGRIEFKRVINETRRGNFKVELTVER